MSLNANSMQGKLEFQIFNLMSLVKGSIFTSIVWFWDKNKYVHVYQNLRLYTLRDIFSAFRDVNFNLSWLQYITDILNPTAHKLILRNFYFDGHVILLQLHYVNVWVAS